MAVTLKDLQVQRNDRIWPAWQKLLKWAKGFRLIGSPEVLLKRTPDGTLVRLRNSRGWSHPFQARLNGRSLRVSRGTLDGLEVWMGTAFLDGLDADGNEVGEPEVEIEGRGPEEGRYTWAALFHRGAKGEERPEIRHVTQLDGSGAPVACIQWAEGEPVRIFQVMHHNQMSAEGRTAGAEGGRRVFYWPV